MMRKIFRNVEEVPDDRPLGDKDLRKLWAVVRHSILVSTGCDPGSWSTALNNFKSSKLYEQEKARVRSLREKATMERARFGERLVKELWRTWRKTGQVQGNINGATWQLVAVSRHARDSDDFSEVPSRIELGEVGGSPHPAAALWQPQMPKEVPPLDVVSVAPLRIQEVIDRVREEAFEARGVLPSRPVLVSWWNPQQKVLGFQPGLKITFEEGGR